MGFIVMFDITSEQSFLNIRPWLDQLNLHSYCENPDIVLCGNKVDLEDRRVISFNRAKCEAAKYGIPYFETSAATSKNVSKSIECLIELVMARMQKYVEAGIPSGSKLIDYANNDSNTDKTGERININSNDNRSDDYCFC